MMDDTFQFASRIEYIKEVRLQNIEREIEELKKQVRELTEVIYERAGTNCLTMQKLSVVVDGIIEAVISVPFNSTAIEIQKIARQNELVAMALKYRTVCKVIVRPKSFISFVVE